ncbi:MAG: helix-turn-helix domain-containing protein [Planctomycetes bacterium]|nr:helix-turn-helix domain-containing protein [Planctomycetota bacterium]
MRTAIDIILTAAERRTLRNRARQSAGRVPLRARIILLAAMGWTNRAIAEKLRTDPHTVARWRNRFAALSCCGNRAGGCARRSPA